jgi:cyclase
MAILAIIARQLWRRPAETLHLAQIEKVRDNLYLITGGGGNTAVFVTSDGVIMIDTKLPGFGQEILNQVRTVTDKPVTYVLNTHTHRDHVGGNAFFSATAEVIAQQNTAARMKTLPMFKEGGEKRGLPNRTFVSRLTLFSGDDTIDLYYFGPAHTDGDALIVFRRLRVMHAGDVFPGKQAPVIDTSAGGSGVAYPETIARAVAEIPNVDTVITGHSTVMTWSDFEEYREFNEAFLRSVQASEAAGRTAQQASAAMKLPEKFKEYDMLQAWGNINTIYAEGQARK